MLFFIFRHNRFKQKRPHLSMTKRRSRECVLAVPLLWSRHIRYDDISNTIRCNARHAFPLTLPNGVLQDCSGATFILLVRLFFQHRQLSLRTAEHYSSPSWHFILLHSILYNYFVQMSTPPARVDMMREMCYYMIIRNGGRNDERQKNRK